MNKCRVCGGELKELEVRVEGSDITSKGWKCKICGHYVFDEEGGRTIVDDLETSEAIEKLPALNIEQRIIKLSKDRLGMYLPKDVVRCTGIEKGKRVYISVLDKKKLLLTVD